MERVKLTFTKSDRGDRVTIQKDGGFTVEDLKHLTETVEELFNGPELERGEPDGDQVGERFAKRVGEAAKTASAGATPPAGRGQVAEKLPDGTGVKQDGTVDRRTLRGTPESPDPKQQATVKRAVRSGEVNAPEAAR